ncbi:hypothetical protein NMY22_g6822 [Coprinellus aureogranulatus]|nr:hypothetical protein NMY22_g6822 [Coprinellus aureogranulatus]
MRVLSDNTSSNTLRVPNNFSNTPHRIRRAVLSIGGLLRSVKEVEYKPSQPSLSLDLTQMPPISWARASSPHAYRSDGLWRSPISINADLEAVTKPRRAYLYHGLHAVDKSNLQSPPCF